MVSCPEEIGCMLLILLSQCQYQVVITACIRPFVALYLCGLRISNCLYVPFLYSVWLHAIICHYRCQPYTLLCEPAPNLMSGPSPNDYYEYVMCHCCLILPYLCVCVQLIRDFTCTNTKYSKGTIFYS